MSKYMSLAIGIIAALVIAYIVANINIEYKEIFAAALGGIIGAFLSHQEDRELSLLGFIFAAIIVLINIEIAPLAALALLGYTIARHT